MKFDFDAGIGSTFKDGGFRDSTMFMEIELGTYDSINEIKENDIVVDIGASVGIVPWLIISNDKRPSSIYMIEPYAPNFELLTKNINNILAAKAPERRIPTCTLLRKSISDSNETHQISWGYNPDTSSTTFKTFVEEYKLETIDFLKIDIEGDEYYIFTEENLNYLNQNTGIILSEFHLSVEGGQNGKKDLKKEFRNFRDNLLPRIEKEYNVLSIDGVDVTWDLWNEHFIEYYDCVLIVFRNK